MLFSKEQQTAGEADQCTAPPEAHHQ
jgi:hypothetical protein